MMTKREGQSKMIIQPKVRGFICTTAHPVGCDAHVKEQIDYVKAQGKVEGPKRVLVIGASTGYGLASRIVSTFGSGASTIGVFFEKPAGGARTASAGWYNTAAFEKYAKAEGFYATSLNGDAFSDALKEQTIARIKEDLGQVDMVVYSLASPRRMHPKTGELHGSVLKPIGTSYTNKTVDVNSGEVTSITLEPANQDEIDNTIAVMGGEDWAFWIDALKEAGVLADGAVTVAYSYIGPKVTHAVYREGTIGAAKDDLEATALRLNEQLGDTGGRAYVSVNKALVTQASAAIPVVPLYISLLYRTMKEKGLHEGCIEQIYRLYADRIYAANTEVDEKGRIRIDDWEMREDVQSEVDKLWEQVTTENLSTIGDIAGYRSEFMKLFGFGVAGIDYDQDVDPNVGIAGIVVEE
jgi:enoyl-[acyl-carrier protein] reductase/trans-2-enoyl-CoA reductase (NAD+)